MGRRKEKRLNERKRERQYRKMAVAESGRKMQPVASSRLPSGYTTADARVAQEGDEQDSGDEEYVGEERLAS